MKCWMQQPGLVGAIAQALAFQFALTCLNPLDQLPTGAAQPTRLTQASPVEARFSKASQPTKKQRSYKPPARPKGKKPIGNWTSTGVRNNCPKTPLKLTAIVPHEDEPAPTDLEPNYKTVLVWSLTTAARPVLWVYTPYSSNQKFSAYLQLDDEQGKIARTAFLLPQIPGIMAIHFPASVNLEVGKLYNWIVRVECGNGIDEVSGWVQYLPVKGKLSQQLATAKPQQQAVLYAQNGYWYDAIATLATMLQKNRTHPQARKLWQPLLEDEGLGAFANQPLVE